MEIIAGCSGREAGRRTLANCLIRWISCCCVRMNGQRCTLRSGVALTACFDGVSVRIARLCVADAQRAGAAAAGDGDASTEVAVVQNSCALLPDKSGRAWTAGRGGEGCGLTFTNCLVSRISRLIRINADVS